jgi:GTP cyclohydrolase I
MINEEFQDEIGDNHVSLSAKNPVRDDAFDLLMMKKLKKRC